jgi:hypothetical protein
VAVGERLRAHHAHTVRERRQRLQVLGDEGRPRRLQGQHLHVPARHAGDRAAVQQRAAAAGRRPFLARAEVVDEAEEDVVDRVAVGNRDGEAEVRNAALRVLGAVDRIDEHAVPAGSAKADLLRDDADVLPLEVLQGRPLRRLVERARVVAALAATDHALALLARRHAHEHVLDVRDRSAAELEPRTGHSGNSSRPEVSFG